MSQNIFAHKKTKQSKVESIQRGFFIFVTYFIIICACAIFAKIIIEGAPVLYRKGFSFVTKKPQTLTVLEVEKAKGVIAPKENYEQMLRANASELPIENVKDYKQAFPFVSFDIENGSIIGDGYLENIEKFNDIYVPFNKRTLDGEVGFEIERDKEFVMDQSEFDTLRQLAPELALGELEQKEVTDTHYKVTVKAGEYSLKKVGYDSLLDTEFVFQMLQSFPDDEPNKINDAIVPYDQTFVVESGTFYDAFDEDENGTITAENVERIDAKKTLVSFKLPTGSYHTNGRALALLTKFGLIHPHNVEKGAIVLELDKPLHVELPAAFFQSMKHANPALKISNVQNTEKQYDYVKFDVAKDAEFLMDVSDREAFVEANESGGGHLPISSEKTHSYSGGGIIGPIVGTAFLVIICMFIALLTGIAAATYLNEYARKGGFTKAIRLAMLNLAGVPSIVFGLFGFGLFVMLAPVVQSTPKVSADLQFKLLPFASLPDLRTQEADKIAIIPEGTSTKDSINMATMQKADRFYNGWTYVSFQGWGTCMLAGGFTLAIMVLPVIITSCEESLKAVPMGFREASLALGASKWQSIRTAVLPYALPGILTASVLGITRVAGETAPIMFTAAAAEKTDLPWQGIHNTGFSWFIDFLSQSVQALPYHIYTVAGKIPQHKLYTQPMQFGSVLVFMLIVLALSAVSIFLRIKIRNKLKW